MIGPTPHLAVVRVGRTAKSVIRFGAPILDVVSRMKTGPAEIRDLVVLVTGVSGVVQHPSVHHAGEIVVGNRLQAAPDMFGQRRARMHLQQIERQMFGTQSEKLLDIPLPACERLAGQACDQIEADVVEAGLAQIRKSLERIGAVMRAAEFRELGVVKRLRSEAGAINSETTKRGELLARDAAGIYFECDL